MLAKVCSVFTGYSKGDFETEKGETIKWCNAAFSVPGTADTFVLKVNLDQIDPDKLAPYKANYLLVDFRYDSKFKNWKGYIEDVFADAAAMNAYSIDDGIPDYLFVDHASAKSAPVPAPAK